MGKIIVYSEGIVHCSVCVHRNMLRKNIVIEVNRLCPTRGGWKISKQKKFRTGEPNPCKCEHNNRLHYLMEC